MTRGLSYGFKTMIVNNTTEGWEIIYQKAHGVLAAALAQHWRKDDRPERWIETLVAISDHDDNQQLWHGTHHLTKQGTPQDFTLQKPDLKQAREVIKASKFKSAWISLLIARHFTNLYEPASGDKQIQQFLNEQQNLIKQLLKALKMSEKQLDEAYKLMYWCDRASLILCKNQIPPDEKMLEIAEGPNNTSYNIKQTSDGKIRILPWPFDVDTFDVRVESRIVDTVVFDDDDHLFETLQKSAIIEKRWCIERE